jgi:DNA repair protein RadD
VRSTLHPHQELAVEMVRASLGSGRRRPVLQAPTAFGKTVVAAAIIERTIARGNRAIFTVPRLSLIDQTVERFTAEGIPASDIGVVQAQHPEFAPERPIQICSLQTLKNRKIPEAKIVLIDEAHENHAFVQKWMADPDWQRVPFIGLTATPWTRGLGKIYDDLIVPTTTAELIEKEFLSKFKVFAPSHPDLAGVKTVAGDYHEGQLSEVMSKKGVNCRCRQNLARKRGRQTHSRVLC